MICMRCRNNLETDAAYCGICGVRTRARRTTIVGTVLDERYQIEARLAEGGFGVIYRATHVASGLDVALKVLHAELARDPSLAARFRREAACLARLHDPHTVATFETGEAPDGTLYIAMELLVGESLHARLAAGPLPWRTALSILRDTCSSLAEAHELGIVHRDLKPANLHLAENDMVKVLDFGIARVARSDIDDGAELTRIGQTVGTFEYMTPEQMVGGTCEPRSDIYQLGILAYEMVTGVRPFVEAAEPAAMITALLTQTPRAPSTRLRPGALPADVDALIMRCLAREPEGRFGSVHRLVDAIENALLGPSPSRRALEDLPTWVATPGPLPAISLAADDDLQTAATLMQPMVEIVPVVQPRFAEGTTAPPFRAPEIDRPRPAPRAPFALRVVGWAAVLAGSGFALGSAVAGLLG